MKAIIDFANNWLQKREVWDVISCETVGDIITVKFSKGGTVTYKKLLTTYSINDEGLLSQWGASYDTLVSEGTACFRVKLLRLWVRPFDSSEFNDKVRPIVPQIQFRDFEPQILDSSSNRFESIDEVVARLNGAINAEVITGKILNVQTLACSATPDWEIDSQTNVSDSWVGRIVYVLRVFYMLGPINEEEVGLADFVPQYLEGGVFRKPKFESQSCVLRNASKWLSENPEINFCSAMSLDVKLKSMVSIDTKRMSFRRGTGDFIRILRIAYTKPREVSADIPISSTLPPPPPVYLEHRVFALHMDYSEIKCTINYFMGRDEWRTSQEQYKWLLLSCETVPVFANNGLKTSLESISDHSFQTLLSSNYTLCCSEYFALKLYYDVGYYGIDHLGVATGTGLPTSLYMREDQAFEPYIKVIDRTDNHIVGHTLDSIT
ncbi:unnamed protein product [Oppiella nova]|uniref:Uncharacterized protein n=1 Tax=Oppiella nova TaxID=334625 RepID=A0A7R9LSH1_9ACAR|nr:unnamed protein product [Oppiella nova]CAG2166541.1 unnamed protein product [Oppiella nova]